MAVQPREGEGDGDLVFLVVDNKGKPPDVPHHLILVSQNQVEVALKSESS